MGRQRRWGSEGQAVDANVPERARRDRQAFALELPFLIMSAGITAVVWRIGTRFLTAAQAVIAALVFWVWPAVFVWIGVKGLIFYVPTMLLGLSMILCAQRATEEKTRYLDWAAAGLFAGAAWWTSPNVSYFLAPAGVEQIDGGDGNRRPPHYPTTTRTRRTEDRRPLSRPAAAQAALGASTTRSSTPRPHKAAVCVIPSGRYFVCPRQIIRVTATFQRDNCSAS